MQNERDYRNRFGEDGVPVAFRGGLTERHPAQGLEAAADIDFLLESHTLPRRHGGVW